MRAATRSVSDAEEIDEIERIQRRIQEITSPKQPAATRIWSNTEITYGKSNSSGD